MAYGRERHPVPSVPRLWQNMKRSPNDKPEKIAIDPSQTYAAKDSVSLAILRQGSCSR